MNDEMWATSLTNDELWATSLTNDSNWMDDLGDAIIRYARLKLKTMNRNYRLLTERVPYRWVSQTKIYRIFTRKDGYI